MAITNPAIVGGLQDESRHKVATSSIPINDGATCGGDGLQRKANMPSVSEPREAAAVLRIQEGG